MNKRTEEYQKQIAEEFIAALSEDGLDWKRGWDLSGAPQNGVSGYKYKGVNALYLSLIQRKYNLEDPRWFTFVQIADRDGTYHKGQKWKLMTGTCGYDVEYAMPVKRGKDGENPHAITWEEYKKLQLKNDFNPSDYYIGKRYTSVFNGSQIEGLEPYKEERKNKIAAHELIDKLSKNLNIEIHYNGGGNAFYDGLHDCIELPPKSAFVDEYELNCTALHELAHATGSKGRLNRESFRNYHQIIDFPEARPKEELIAEISSAMMSCHISEELPTLDNHKAYVHSWCRTIGDNPKFLIDAIKQSEDTVNYMEYKAELKSKDEYEKNKSYKLIKGKSQRKKAPDVDLGHGMSRVSLSKRERNPQIKNRNTAMQR